MVRTFWLVLGYFCNNRCGGCYAEPSQFKSPYMPYQYAKDVIGTMAANSVKKCLLIGGEPTLHPQLIEIIESATTRDIYTTLVTNGRKIASLDFVHRLKTAGIGRIVISIQGSSAEIHNHITKTDSFSETWQGITNCLLVGVRLSTITTISQSNEDDCPQVPFVLAKLGVEDITFNCGIPSVGKIQINTENTLPPDRIATVIKKIYTKARAANIHTHFNITIPVCLFPQDVLTGMSADRSIAIGCQMYEGKGIAFDPMGSVLPCTHFADFPLSTGCMDDQQRFVHRKTLLNIWQNTDGPPSQFRQKLWRYPVSTCSQCRYWGRCIGGCPLFWAYYNPGDFITNPAS